MRLAAGLLIGCVLAMPARAEVVSIADAVGTSLIVEIAWNDPVDLDIFLTDPPGETVYFANRLAKGGAVMGRESGCAEAAQGDGPYSETIRIPTALSGRYRVSVDFIKDCGNTTLKADLRVVVKSADGTVLGRGKSDVQYRNLNPVAWEFDVK